MVTWLRKYFKAKNSLQGKREKNNNISIKLMVAITEHYEKCKYKD